MVWRRLPAHFPNLRLRMLPVAEEQMAQLQDIGWLREVAFRTQPKVNKIEIKTFLEQVYGLQVERVSTINYQGKKKRQLDRIGREHWYRQTDWKKAYVIFKPPPESAAAEELARLRVQAKEEQRSRLMRAHQARRAAAAERVAAAEKDRARAEQVVAPAADDATPTGGRQQPLARAAEGRRRGFQQRK